MRGVMIVLLLAQSSSAKQIVCGALAHNAFELATIPLTDGVQLFSCSA